MSDVFKHIKDFLTLDYRALFILSGVCWLFVLVPESAWQYLGLEAAGATYRPVIALAAMSFSGWLVLAGVFDGLRWVRDGLQTARDVRKTIKSTSQVERAILAAYISENTTTLAFDVRDGVVNGLISKGILYTASKLSNPMSYSFDINLQPWAWEYLRKHPGILKGVEPDTEGRHSPRYGSR